ncbi:MAG: translation initiation factor IF-3 [Deltaproteobacteria bacterium]|nr:translation initiation factor IF-3 [Deltaproteobacteria bacterium]
MAKHKQADKQVNINRDIRAKEVRVIDAEGNQLGVIPLDTALLKADEVGLDLVEVSPTANPPVCKIMDYGRFRYQQTKKMQEARKKQAVYQLKEIKLRPKTDTHDLEIKIGHLKRFIEKKNKVKVTVMFRGREITMRGRARELLDQIAETAKEFAAIEMYPKMEGRTMTMVLAPKPS